MAAHEASVVKGAPNEAPNETLGEGAFGVEALGRDAQQVVQLVQALAPDQTDKARFDMARVASYLEKHQEQPELLDPYLEGILTPLVARMRQHANNDVLEDVSKVLYVLVKVRGYKTVGEWLTKHGQRAAAHCLYHCASSWLPPGVSSAFACRFFWSTPPTLAAALSLPGLALAVKFFPHETVDLEPVFHLLVQHNETKTSAWEVCRAHLCVQRTGRATTRRLTHRGIWVV